ncbi:hypothetical protein ACOME3_007890 [Neoechinorhynchus agilis]
MNYIPPDDFPRFKVSLQDQIPCRIMYMSGPDNIYVVPSLIWNDFLNIQQRLNRKYERLVFRPKYFYLQNSKCVAKSQTDSKWYRGRITNINEKENRYEVLFLDYGHSEWLPLLNLRPVKKVFNAIPILALPCKLDLLRGDFTGLIEQELVPDSKICGDVTCDLYRKDEDDGKYLININMASKFTSFTDLENLCVSQLEMESYFYTNKEVFNIDGIVAEHFNMKEISVGSFALLKCGTRRFERVKIMKLMKDDDALGVEKIDSGKRRCVPKELCFSMAPMLSAIPKMCHRCQVVRITPLDEHKQAVKIKIDKLHDRYSSGGRLIVKIVGYNVPNRKFLVELFILKKNGLRDIGSFLKRHILVDDPDEVMAEYGESPAKRLAVESYPENNIIKADGDDVEMVECEENKIGDSCEANEYKLKLRGDIKMA